MGLDLVHKALGLVRAAIGYFEYLGVKAPFP